MAWWTNDPAKPGACPEAAVLLQASRKALRVAIGYALLGALWIMGSDAALAVLTSDPSALNRLQTFKGWFYVVVTSALLYAVLRRLLLNDGIRLQRQIRQRNELRVLGQFRESIIDNASIWINVLDAQARVTIWNKAAEQISGYTRDEVIGHAGIWAQLYPDEAYRDDIAKRAMAILDDGVEVEGFQTRIRCRDGQYKYISWNSRRFFGENGERSSIAIGHDVTERNRMQQELEHLAVHDALTGLYNRRKFEALAAQALAACTRDGRAFALLWIDIDGFKGVNDRFGHQVGDDTLRRIGAILREQIGEEGVAARYGGDEMVAALPGCDGTQARALAEELCRQVRQARLLAARAGAPELTISVGVACRDAQLRDLESLAVAADHAMYRAKAGGRDRVCEAEGMDGIAPRP